MKRLQIETELARIGIKTHPAKMSINNSIRRFKNESTSARPIIETKRPRFKVDWQAVRAQTGLAGTVELSKQFRASGKQAAREDLRDIVQRGNMMEDGAQSGGPNVGQIAKHFAAPEPVEVVFASMPQSPPSIEWDIGYTKISWEPYELQLQWDDEYLPDISVERHSVEIFLQNKPSITISVIEDGFLIQHGYNMDKTV